jgi:hypothetical protein
MKKKIIGIVILMLVATTVVSATNINVKKSNNVSVNSEPYEPGLFEWWGVDQKQTTQDGYGITLIPPETNAQSFTPTKDKLTAVSLYLFKAGTPSEPVHITVSIRGNLTGPDLATKTIDTSVVTISTATWVLFDFDDITITPESKYFIICSGDAGDANNAYCWLFSSSDRYTPGEAWHKATAGSSWIKWPTGSTSPADFCFKTYFRKPLDVSSIPQTVPSTPQASTAGIWMETQKLLASDGMGNDGFAMVSLDGDTALIGAPGDNNGIGSVYVFTRTGTTWTEQQKLSASDGQPDDYFGMYISLDGDTVLIGAGWDDDNGVDSGSAYIFTRTGTTWTQQQKLLASDGAAGDCFGCYAVSLSGGTALIGAFGDDEFKGSGYVFTRTGTTWTQQAKLLASDGVAEDYFGYAVSLDGDTAIINGGVHDEDKGAVYVFTRTGTTWTQQQKLLASDGAEGDEFGISLSIDGDNALISARWDDENNKTDCGSAYVFTRTGTTWTQQAKLLASDGHANDRFAWPVTLDGDTALIGVYQDDDNGVDSGSAYIFTRTGTTWTQQQKLLASDSHAGDWFGIRIAFDGNTILIGAGYDDDNGINSGSAYVFTRTGLTFSISGGIGVKAVITNDGTSDVNDIPWQIHVEGGILGLINKTVNGTIDIPVGKSVTVKTGTLLGFGAISITAKVADEEQTATGTQIIIFSMVPK